MFPAQWLPHVPRAESLAFFGAVGEELEHPIVNLTPTHAHHGLDEDLVDGIQAWKVAGTSQ
jgi:hypothetical protein